MGKETKRKYRSLPRAFLSCFGKKGSKEADLWEALTESLSECTASLYTGIPTLSRPPPRPPPGRCASVKRAEIEWEYTQLTILFTRWRVMRGIRGYTPKWHPPASPVDVFLYNENHVLDAWFRSGQPLSRKLNRFLPVPLTQGSLCAVGRPYLYVDRGTSPVVVFLWEAIRKCPPTAYIFTNLSL